MTYYRSKIRNRLAPKPIAIGLAAALCTVNSTSLLAQSSGARLEEVVVTATKRSESIHDVPIAITVLSSEMLDRAGITDITSLERVAPSFNLNTTDSATGGVTLRVRGVGTSGNNIGFESSYFCPTSRCCFG